MLRQGSRRPSLDLPGRLWVAVGNLLFVVLAGCVAARAAADRSAKSIIVDSFCPEKRLLTVYFVDVGQGDAALIDTPNHHRFMIDTGPRSARKNLVRFLKSVGARYLEFVLITHSHLDHDGGLYYLLDKIKVSKLLYSGFFHTSKYNEKLLRRAVERNVKLVKVRRGAKIKFDDGVVLTVLHPPPDAKPVVERLNDFSVVTRLSYGQVDFLFTGDAEIPSEKVMLAAKLVLEAEVLKVGHHGSKTASSLRFLRAVSPLLAVISVGAKNKYGLPDEEVLARLRRLGIVVLRTDRLGTIQVQTDGEYIKVRTQKGKWRKLHAKVVLFSGNTLIAISGGKRWSESGEGLSVSQF